MKDVLIPLFSPIISGVFAVIVAMLTADRMKSKAEQAEAIERAAFRQQMQEEMKLIKEQIAVLDGKVTEHNGYGKIFADFSQTINVKLAKLETIIEERTNR